MNTPREGRGTRSRNSSPYVGAPSNAANSSRNSNSERPERPRTLLDKWIEPPLPAPRPSFADAGIERHGVVQNMAPLGTRPTAKQMKAVTARLESEVFGKGSVRRAAASTVTTPGESTMTPEPTAPPTNLQEEAQRETPEVQTAMKAQEEVAQEEVASPIQSVSRSSVPPSLPPTQANGQGVFALSQSPASTAPMAPMASMHTPLSNHTSQAAGSYFASSTPNMTPTHTFIPAQTPFYAPPNQPHQSPYPVQTPTPSSLTPLVVPPLPMDEDGKPSINLELTDKIVEAAVQEALDRFKWPTAYALRTLYDDHRKNIRIVRLIEAVYNGRASDRDYQEFNIIMRKKKREGKANRTGEYYFNGDGSDLAPAPTPAPAPAPAPVPHISNLIQAVQPPARPYQTPYSTLPARPSTANSTATDPQPARASSLARSSVPASPLNQPDQHVDKRLKSNNVLPSMELNGNAGANRTKMSQSPAPNGMIKTTPKKVRSNSDSSSSSLSSVDEQLLEETVISPPRPPSSRLGPGSIAARLGLLGGNAAQQRSFVSPYASANNFAALASAAEPGRNQPQPISSQANASPKPLSSTATASSLDIPSSTQNPSATNNNTTTNDDNLSPTPNNMAPAALLSQDSISSSNSPPPVVPAKFRKNKNHLNGPVSTVVQHPEVPSKKRSAREISNSQSREESFVRGSFQGAPAVQAPDSSDDADSISAQPPTKKSKQQKLKLNVRKSKTYQTRNAGNSVEEEPDSSPTALGFRPDLAPGSVNTSRAGTPQQFARPTRKGKPTGSGLRLKSSPVKKKGGTNAGLPKESGPRSPTGNGAVGNQEELENNDFCSGCGGNGDLVCCDGCIRSFHFKCVDPPLADGALPDEWFCNKCQVKFDDDRGWSFQRVKVFDQLQFWLAETNPHSFSLPKDVREYFTDVKTGPEGEYEVEQAPPPPKGKKSKNDDETNIDYFRKKDSKGNTVLCYHCNGSAQAPDRMIIPCSFCGLNWHLDCLPNPLAKEPNPLRQWRCPAHVDDLLATLPQFLGPAHRFRTIKGAPVEIPAIARGFKNSGHIQIVNDEIEPEEEPGFFEAREFGKIYRLPEKGIVLDFISKVKQQGGGYVPSKFSARVERKSVLNNTAKAWKKTTDALNNKWNKSDLYEKQAALNLAAIATSTPEIASAGSIDNLVDTLISEASPAAISLIGRGDASELAGTGKLSKEGKAAMMAIKAAIDSRLEADLSEEVASVPTTSDPITTEPDDADTRMSTPDDAPQVPEIEL